MPFLYDDHVRVAKPKLPSSERRKRKGLVISEKIEPSLTTGLNMTKKNHTARIPYMAQKIPW